MKGTPVRRATARPLHPGAWWLWALSLAAIASRTTNLLLFGLVVGVVVLVVLACRGDAPWALSFRLYAILAGAIVVLRVLFRVVFAANGQHILFRLPEINLFAFKLFGPVSSDALLAGLQTGAQLGVMVLCIGAANALASPKRLLAAAPGSLYEFGTIAVVTLSAFPQLAESVRRVNQARLLRGLGGRHLVRQVLMPVLADALDRSLCLAGAMDARGYGRQAALPGRVRLAANVALLTGVCALCIGLYGLLSGAAMPLGGVTVWAMVLGGIALAGVSLRLAGRRAVRSRYRPDPWRGIEWLVVLCGLVPAVVMAVPGADRSPWLLAVVLAALPAALVQPEAVR